MVTAGQSHCHHTTYAYHDVDLPVDVLEELFKAPEATLANAKKGLHEGLELRISRLILELLLHVCQYGPYKLDDGDDEGTKGHSPNMKAGGRGWRERLEVVACRSYALVTYNSHLQTHIPTSLSHSLSHAHTLSE